MSVFNKYTFQDIQFREVINLNNFKEVCNNFIQKFICSFHDYDNLYLITKLYDGFIINHLDYSWNEKQIQFFSACLIQSFDSLRKKKLIHRDIHFGNIVLDEKQYINLIDFHIAIKYKDKNDPKRNFIGSPQLCAPEMIDFLEYDYNSDYYRLGGMIYYIIFKKYPNEIKKEENKTDIYINYDKSLNYSFSCIDFVNQLIITNNKKRIGFNDIEELKNHDFFKNFDWNKLINGNMISPFKKILDKKLALCSSPFIFKKKFFIKTELLKDENFTKKFFMFDNINYNAINEIIKSF